MTDFLFRMVQRAAGWPSSTPAPQPPSQFHWPASVDTSVMPPTRTSGTADASSRAGRRSIIPPPRANSSAAKRDMPAITSPDSLLSESPRMIQTPTTNPAPANSKITESGPVIPQADETAAPPANQRTDAAQLSVRTQQAHLKLIEHAISAMNEPTSETRPISPRENIPARLTPPAQTRVPRSPRGSRPQEPPPAVEVKIGSVEIVFDQPPVQAAQPARVRPAGFAEFADLRRYAARPWASRSR